VVTPIEDRAGRRGFASRNRSDGSRPLSARDLRSRSRTEFGIRHHCIRTWDQGSQSVTTTAPGEEMKTLNFSEGWDEERVRRGLEHTRSSRSRGGRRSGIRIDDAYCYGDPGRARRTSPRTSRQTPRPLTCPISSITSLSVALVLGAVKTSSLRDAAACRGASGLDRASAPARCGNYVMAAHSRGRV
jgi:hypothetical protein